MEREQASNLQAGKGLQAEGREPAAAFYSHIHTLGRQHRKGWMGRLLRTPAPGPSSASHRALSGSFFVVVVVVEEIGAPSRPMRMIPEVRHCASRHLFAWR